MVTVHRLQQTGVLQQMMSGPGAPHAVGEKPLDGADLAIRASELEAFYTEDGMLPRALLRGPDAGAGGWCPSST